MLLNYFEIPRNRLQIKEHCMKSIELLRRKLRMIMGIDIMTLLLFVELQQKMSGTAHIKTSRPTKTQVIKVIRPLPLGENLVEDYCIICILHWIRSLATKMNVQERNDPIWTICFMFIFILTLLQDESSVNNWVSILIYDSIESNWIVIFPFQLLFILSMVSSNVIYF